MRKKLESPPYYVLGMGQITPRVSVIPVCFPHPNLLNEQTFTLLAHWFWCKCFRMKVSNIINLFLWVSCVKCWWHSLNTIDFTYMALWLRLNIMSKCTAMYFNNFYSIHSLKIGSIALSLHEESNSF